MFPVCLARDYLDTARLDLPSIAAFGLDLFVCTVSVRLASGSSLSVSLGATFLDCVCRGLVCLQIFNSGELL